MRGRLPKGSTATQASFAASGFLSASSAAGLQRKRTANLGISGLSACMIRLNHRQKQLSWAAAVLAIGVCLVLPLSTGELDGRIWIRLAAIVVFYLILLALLRQKVPKG
jgi:hypothetical protein